eukprot:2707324-Amphidinium_carterae.1
MVVDVTASVQVWDCVSRIVGPAAAVAACRLMFGGVGPPRVHNHDHHCCVCAHYSCMGDRAHWLRGCYQGLLAEHSRYRWMQRELSSYVLRVLTSDAPLIEVRRAAHIAGSVVRAVHRCLRKSEQRSAAWAVRCRGCLARAASNIDTVVAVRVPKRMPWSKLSLRLKVAGLSHSLFEDHVNVSKHTRFQYHMQHSSGSRAGAIA